MSRAMTVIVSDAHRNVVWRVRQTGYCTPYPYGGDVEIGNV